MEKWPEEYPDPDKTKKEGQLYFDEDDFKPHKSNALRKGLILLTSVTILIIVGICIGSLFSTLFLFRAIPVSIAMPALIQKVQVTSTYPTTEASNAYPTPTPIPPAPGMVFSNHEGLWLTNDRWQIEQISDRPGARLSTNGRYLAFIDQGELHLLDRETNESRLLTTEVTQSVCCVQWWTAHPDTILVRPWHDHIGWSDTGLATITIDGDYQLIDETSTVSDSPAPSPDGTAIAYSKNGQLAIYHWHGEIELLDLSEFGLPNFAKATFPAWSPDSNKLAWIASNNISSEVNAEMNIIILDLAQQTGHIVHTFTGNWNAYDWLDIPNAPAWSWDGKWLAFHAEGGLWISSPDGAASHFLGPGFSPKWAHEYQRGSLELVANRFETGYLISIFGERGYQIGINGPESGRIVEWRPVP